MIYYGRKNSIMAVTGPRNLTQDQDERTHLASTII